MLLQSILDSPPRRRRLLRPDRRLRDMHIAWFSPLPPVRSGIAAYTAELLPQLTGEFVIDTYTEANAHEFVWTNRLAPYGLSVYQLGNAPCHDYMWAYLTRYPGLTVLHDARLHHARARALLDERRADDYRREFRYDHPHARPDAAEYAVEGLSGSIYYLWPMLRVALVTARMVAVHNRFVANDLAAEYPATAVETIRMGVPLDPISADPQAAARVRVAIRRALRIPDHAIVFAAFGKVTPEKRIGAIVESVEALRREGVEAWLLVVGDAAESGRPLHPAESSSVDHHVIATGYVPDASVDAYLAAADVCLCLRWPTALETSASWLRCLAAARPTLVSDLAHLADVPLGAALRIDLVDETRALMDAMRRLAHDPRERATLASAGREHWSANHRLELMAEDYRRVLRAAVRMPVPPVTDLPDHFREDHTGQAREIARRFGVDFDALMRR
jgi:glycosyltransferase involved in cell wall biosynthesis